nr:uncharacterized protein LOC127303467 [Lolium perenne]
MVDGEMPERVDDAAFMEAMNVGSSFLHDDEAADGEEEYEDVDEEGEGLIEPRHPGRAANYTIAEDKLLCKTWLTIGMDPTTGIDQTRETYWMRMTEYFNTNTSGIERTMRSLRSRWSGINTDCQKWAGVQANIDVLNPSGTNENDRNSMAQGLFRDVGKKNKKGNKILGKPFTLHHCYEVLGNEEKWKTRGKLDAATMAANATGDATIIDDDDSSDEGKKRSSTPHSVNNGRRNVHGRKTAKEMKGRKAGDDDIAMAMERIANARLQANEDRKMQRNLEKEAMDAIEARRAALEERIAANEERKLALEEKRQASEEYARLAEEERKLFLMDTSHMDERQKEYINLLRDEVLAKKRVLVANLNTSTTDMFGGDLGGARASDGEAKVEGVLVGEAAGGDSRRHGRSGQPRWRSTELGSQTSDQNRGRLTQGIVAHAGADAEGNERLQLVDEQRKVMTLEYCNSTGRRAMTFATYRDDGSAHAGHVASSKGVAEDVAETEPATLARRGRDGGLAGADVRDELAGMILGAQKMSEEKTIAREWRRGKGLAGARVAEEE